MAGSIDLSKLDVIVFDCDGVILDSNRVKTDAFYEAALPFGEEAATKLVEHHVRNGGVSRFKKFRHFIDNIVQLEHDIESTYESLLSNYANAVARGLRSCAITPNLAELKARTPNATWFVASGGAQVELRDVFAERKIDHFFDGGIFGSPDTKEIILERELKNQPRTQGLFLGDSKYDHIAAQHANLDFVFVNGWTEMENWKEYCIENQISWIDSVETLMTST